MFAEERLNCTLLLIANFMCIWKAKRYFSREFYFWLLDIDPGPEMSVAVNVFSPAAYLFNYMTSSPVCVL